MFNKNHKRLYCRTNLNGIHPQINFKSKVLEIVLLLVKFECQIKQGLINYVTAYLIKYNLFLKLKQ